VSAGPSGPNRAEPVGPVDGGWQWTGAEPQNLQSIGFAQDAGAVWEGDELVTYNLAKLAHDVEHHPDGYMEDSD
jgi:hypothetical protein